MAGPEDPFTPGPTADPTAGIPNMDTFENIRGQWATFLDQPGARTALLQTGLALMQPPQFGQTPAGHIASAIGEGGAAVSRQQAEQSKQELEGARAEAAGARSREAAQRLPLEYFKRQSIEQGQAAGNLKNAHSAFQRSQNALFGQYKVSLQEYEKSKLTTPSAQLGPPPQDPRQDPSFNDFGAWLRSPSGAHFASLPGVSTFAAPRQAAQPPTAPQQPQEEGGD